MSNHCRSCGARIDWRETDSGKKMPVNPDGTSHFATCPDADKWRVPKDPIEVVELSGFLIREFQIRNCFSHREALNAKGLPGKGDVHPKSANWLVMRDPDAFPSNDGYRVQVWYARVSDDKLAELAG